VKLAILGGSFNPPHIGHLHLAEAALSAGYDRVILIPAFISPFKPGLEGARPQDRLDMLAASTGAESVFMVDDCEIRREGVSYTIDTINDIIRRYCPDGKPGLVLGDDLALNFVNWRNAAEIVEKADLVIARRTLSGEPVFPFPARFLDNAVLELSSRDLRRNIGGGGPWRALVPEGARLIIEDRRLYGYPDRQAASVTGGSGGVISSLAGISGQAGIPGHGIRGLSARVEAAARSMLTTARFLHSRGVAIVAADLAGRFGVDPDTAYLAGIAHDIAKELPEKELRRYARRDGGNFSSLEKKKPSLLHGRAAAGLVRDRFGIENPAVLEAVRHHTSGNPGMGDLAKIIYIADKTEPSRPGIDGELRRCTGYSSLDSYFFRVFRETVAWLEAKHCEIAPGTRKLLAAMRKKGTP
jgi:nicotinate-nucleotide adenylyltransferase